MNSVIERIGDVSVDSTPVAIARALGCDRVDKVGHFRCRLEIPLNAYEPLNKVASRPEFLKFPPDAHRLPDMKLGDVPEWYVLSGFCKCGYFRNVEVKALRKGFSADTQIHDIARYLRCKRCGNKKENFFIYQKMLR